MPPPEPLTASSQQQQQHPKQPPPQQTPHSLITPLPLPPTLPSLGKYKTTLTFTMAMAAAAAEAQKATPATPATSLQPSSPSPPTPIMQHKYETKRYQTNNTKTFTANSPPARKKHLPTTTTQHTNPSQPHHQSPSQLPSCNTKQNEEVTIEEEDEEHQDIHFMHCDEPNNEQKPPNAAKCKTHDNIPTQMDAADKTTTAPPTTRMPEGAVAATTAAALENPLAGIQQPQQHQMNLCHNGNSRQGTLPPKYAQTTALAPTGLNHMALDQLQSMEARSNEQLTRLYALDDEIQMLCLNTFRLQQEAETITTSISDAHQALARHLQRRTIVQQAHRQHIQRPALQAQMSYITGMCKRIQALHLSQVQFYESATQAAEKFSSELSDHLKSTSDTRDAFEELQSTIATTTAALKEEESRQMALTSKLQQLKEDKDNYANKCDIVKSKQSAMRGLISKFQAAQMRIASLADRTRDDASTIQSTGTRPISAAAQITHDIIFQDSDLTVALPFVDTELIDTFKHCSHQYRALQKRRVAVAKSRAAVARQRREAKQRKSMKGTNANTKKRKKVAGDKSLNAKPSKRRKTKITAQPKKPLDQTPTQGQEANTKQQRSPSPAANAAMEEEKGDDFDIGADAMDW